MIDLRDVRAAVEVQEVGLDNEQARALLAEYDTIKATANAQARLLLTTDNNSIRSLQAELLQYTKDKGWDDDRGFSDLVLLMVTELAEAVEPYRDWWKENEIRVEHGKPEGIPVELADCVIRILTFCNKFGIDLQDVVRQKMEYNNTRPVRHGGRKI